MPSPFLSGAGVEARLPEGAEEGDVSIVLESGRHPQARPVAQQHVAGGAAEHVGDQPDGIGEGTRICDQPERVSVRRCRTRE